MISKIYKIFSRKEKILLLFFISLLSIGAFLEIIGLILIIPFTSLLLNKKEFLQNEYLPNFITNLYDLGVIELIYLFGILLIIFYVTKNIYLSIINYLSFQFIYKKYRRLAKTLFLKYLYLDYESHKNSDPSIFQRNINTEILNFTANIMIPLLLLFSELIVILFILISLILVEPLYTIIVVFFFAIIFSVISILVKSKTSKLGYESQTKFGNMISTVNQSFNSIKMIKLHDRYNFFVNKFDNNLKIFAANSALSKNIVQWPRYFTEIIVIFVIVTSSILITKNQNDILSLLPVLSFFALAGFRLMPSFNRILSSYNNMIYFSASVNVVYKELNLLKINNFNDYSKKNNSKFIFKNKVSMQNVSFKYKESNKKTLSNISLDINKGQRVAFIGKTGSGKSTLVDILLGLIKQKSGKVNIDNLPIENIVSEWQQIIGYVPQNIYLLNDKIISNIAYGIDYKNIDKNKIYDSLKKSQLFEFVNNLSEKENTEIGENGYKLSGGERQRLGIARALYQNPKILVIDEGTSSLDLETQMKINETILKLNKDITIIVIAHRLELIKEFDKVFQIENGNLVKTFQKKDIVKVNSFFN